MFIPSIELGTDSPDGPVVLEDSASSSSISTQSVTTVGKEAPLPSEKIDTNTVITRSIKITELLSGSRLQMLTRTPPATAMKSTTIKQLCRGSLSFQRSRLNPVVFEPPLTAFLKEIGLFIHKDMNDSMFYLCALVGSLQDDVVEQSLPLELQTGSPVRGAVCNSGR